MNDLKIFLYGDYSDCLVKFYGCYYETGYVKLVLEYMDMGSLRNVVKLVNK